MFALILFIAVIALLILTHEWGHFYSARKLGVKVEEFGFGFPPKLFAKVKNGVRYSFNLFPFGGFVKIFGESGEGENNPDSFISRPVRQRFLIIASGVLINLFLAWILFSLGSFFGVPVSAEKEDTAPVSIIAVLPDSPAEKAGLKIGDKILEMKFANTSQKIVNEDEVRKFVEKYGGEKISILIERGKKHLEIAAIPRVNFPEGEGPLGIALTKVKILRTPWYLAPFEGLQTTGRVIIATIYGFGLILKDLIFEGKTSIQVAGPIGIFTLSRDMQTLGISYFLQFVGIISVNLAILNSLPIPALDGGRMLFLAVEKLRRKKINPKVENLIHTIGFVVLIFFMILITYHDIVKIL